MTFHHGQKSRVPFGSVADPLSLLTRLFARAPVGLAVWTADATPVLMNEAFITILRVASPHAYDALQDDRLAGGRMRDLFKRALRGETVNIPTFWYEPREQSPVEVTGAGRFAISLTMFALRNDEGHVDFVAAKVKNETELALTSEDLRLTQSRWQLAQQASEARFRRLGDAGIIGIIITDTFGNIHDANDTFLEIVGFTREDLTSGSVRWNEMTPAVWRPLDVAAIEQLMTTGAAKPWEKEYIRKDGTRVPVLVGVAVLEGPQCVAFVLDLSERKQAERARRDALAAAETESAGRERAEVALRDAEEQLRQSQKMEAIGALAGGIAHDFNNLLSVILGYTESILDELPQLDPIRADVLEIARAGQRAREMTKQLLAFSHQQVLQPKLVNLNDTIGAMIRMLHRLIGEDIELAFFPSEHLGPVCVDASQIEQVLLNLVVNARDAMPTGGKLTLETANVDVAAADAQSHAGAAAGPYVMVAVTDTGVGMDRATRSRIFEPFFTTKGARGTGLGLSTVFGIVRQSRGSIVVSSELGRGSTFKVYLPRLEDVDATAPASALPAKTTRGSETVLLVEDDAQVRSLVATVLQRNGYRVLDAASSGEALLISEQFEGPIQLLLADVVMPRLGGRQIWERLVPSRPEMKVLFMSGYADNGILDNGIASGDLALIPKPILPRALLAKIREVLGSAD